MSNEPVITAVGNLTSDPELRFTSNGIPVASFTIAQTPREKKGEEWVDGEAIFFRATVWREFAEHVAGSLTKGARVIAMGRLKNKSYETKEGEKRTSLELEIEAIGPDLRYATAAVTRAAGGTTGRTGQQAANAGWATPNGSSTPSPATDSWATPAYVDDPTPF